MERSEMPTATRSLARSGAASPRCSVKAQVEEERLSPAQVAGRLLSVAPALVSLAERLYRMGEGDGLAYTKQEATRSRDEVNRCAAVVESMASAVGDMRNVLRERLDLDPKRQSIESDLFDTWALLRCVGSRIKKCAASELHELDLVLQLAGRRLDSSAEELDQLANLMDGAEVHGLEASQAFETARSLARRMRFLAEASGSNLRELKGCEIDREDMLEVLNLIEESADELRVALGALKPAGYQAGAAA